MCCGGDGVTYANTCVPKAKGIVYTVGACQPVTPGGFFGLCIRMLMHIRLMNAWTKRQPHA